MIGLNLRFRTDKSTAIIGNLSKCHEKILNTIKERNITY